MNRRIGLVVTGLAAAAVMAGGTAVAASASIPGSDGTIYGCYDGGGNLKVIDNSVTTTCPKGYTSLNWNYKGIPGAQGASGANGNTILSGSGAPGASAGNSGDFYLDTSADVLYGPKTSNGWPATGTSLVGQQGPKGDTGPAGTDAAPEFTWTYNCTPTGSVGSCDALSNTSIPSGMTITPRSVTASGGCSTSRVYILDFGDFVHLAEFNWNGAAGGTSLSQPDTFTGSAPLEVLVSLVPGCTTPVTVTFSFDETNSFN